MARAAKKARAVRTFPACPRAIFYIFLLLYALLLAPPNRLVVSAFGGEKATLDLVPLTEGITFRQDLCDRNNAFQNKTIELRDALRGLELRVGVREGPYFILDERDKGIDATYPGIAAVILDELGRRAGFTWRNSFAALYRPEEGNVSWTDVLAWSVDVYDISANRWDHGVERMQRGATFLNPWYDSSIILIMKKDESETTSKRDIDLWNWLLPFDVYVWWLILGTVLFSGFIHLWLEYMAGERDERTWGRWASDSIYASLLNFTQVSVKNQLR